MMKRSMLISAVLFICLVCVSAGASPAMTDGETTGWIADNNYLYLQTSTGMVAQLSMPIDELVRFTEDELICLSRDHQVIAVKKNGSGSRIVENADSEAPAPNQLRLEDGILYLGELQISTSACAAATDGRYVYVAERAGESFVLRVSAVQTDGQLIMQQSRDMFALALSGKTVPEPLSITVTREALTLTGTDHQVTVMNLLTGEVSRYPASGTETAAACVQNGMLYRYRLTEGQKWELESGEALARPTPTMTPVPTSTPRPTQGYQGETDQEGTIYFGAYGRTVRKIQTRLSELGYPISKIDGKYGEETQLAINLFCDAIHVREHRYITQKVQKKLFAKEAPYYDPYLPLKQGDQGVSVLYMQLKLKELGYDPGKTDGIYGKNTAAAVALFQEANNMLPGPGDKEKPGEAASRELLELLYTTLPGPGPGPDPTATPTQTSTPATPSDLK